MVSAPRSAEFSRYAIIRARLDTPYLSFKNHIALGSVISRKRQEQLQYGDAARTFINSVSARWLRLACFF